jgi:hypothetical protein
MKNPIEGRGTIFVSSLIIVIVMGLALCRELPGLESGEDQFMPFLFALLGLALYVMASVRKKRERFDRRYLPDYFFRGAQTVIYLYVVLAIFVMERGKDSQYDLETWPPVLLGLLVGMYILHVEKAMEALGQRFQEVLTAILGRAVTARTEREKQVEQISLDRKFREIRAQAEAIASQIRDPALAQALQARIEEVGQAFRDGDLDGIADEVTRLAWQFEDAKRSLREEELTVEELIASLRRGADPDARAPEPAGAGRDATGD